MGFLIGRRYLAQQNGGRVISAKSAIIEDPAYDPKKKAKNRSLQIKRLFVRTER